MKAIIHSHYGPPQEVLAYREVSTPSPKAGEVLVNIHAASLNFGDRSLVKGKPFLIRLMGYGLLKPKHSIPGGDIAGHVEAIGGNVKQFQTGDPVFADIGDCGMGALAEYVTVPAEVLVPKPSNITFEQAAAVPQAAVVALQGLRNNGNIQPGHKVLVNGASGGVGTFAVQIAKALRAEVTGVCSQRNMELVSSIGAHKVLDYQQEDFTQASERYDLIFDIVANRSLSDYLRALNSKGHYVACAFNPSSLFLGGLISKSDGKKASSLVHKPNREDLAFLAELLESGKVIPIIDRQYPLQAVAEAMAYLDGGQHRGKVVINIKGEA